MGWDALLFGELTFPQGGIDAWKRLVIQEGLYRDKAWKQSSMMGEPTDTVSVAEMLEKLEDHARWCEDEYPGPDHQRVTVDGNRVSVRACINEDDFRSWAGNIATMLRLAEKVGATGEYVALANDANDAERLVLANGASRCERIDGVAVMTGEGLDTALDYAGIVEEIFRRTQEKVQGVMAGHAAKAPSTKAPAKKAPAKKTPTEKTPAKKAPAKKTPAKKRS